VEKVGRNGMARGYGEHYLPVTFRTETPERNRFKQVTLSGVDRSGPLMMKGAHE
jgi:hypothetical protein